MPSPFYMQLWDRSFAWKGPLDGIESLDATVRHNDAGSATLGVPSDNPRIATLNTPGARVGIQFRDGHLISGLIHKNRGTSRKGRGKSRSGVQYFDVVDDKQVLKNIRAWPAPLRTEAQQGDENAYYTLGRRAAETVLKDVVTKNIVQRLGMPFTVEADQGRGGIMESTFRFHPIYDRVFPAFDLAGLGYNIRSRTGGRVLEVYVPRNFALPLSEEDRTIQNADWAKQAPTVSRGVVAGQGEGKARIIRGFKNTALETEWGEIWETMVDARDTGDGDTYALRGQEALAGGAARGSVSLDLMEAGNFVYGGTRGVKVGDRITAQVNNGQASIVDVLREVTMTWNRANGLVIRSTVGVKDNPTAPVLDAITALGKGVRDLKAGR